MEDFSSESIEETLDRELEQVQFAVMLIVCVMTRDCRWSAVTGEAQYDIPTFPS